MSVGDYVKEGADIVNLESIDPLKVDFRVPEIYMKQVQVGQSLQVQLDAMPGKTFEGKVFAVNPLRRRRGTLDRDPRAWCATRTRACGPGMFARVRLITKDEQNALVVPEQAIVPQGDEQFVFRVVDGKARAASRSRSASAATARSEVVARPRVERHRSSPPASSSCATACRSTSPVGAQPATAEQRVGARPQVVAG